MDYRRLIEQYRAGEIDRKSALYYLRNFFIQGNLPAYVAWIQALGYPINPNTAQIEKLRKITHGNDLIFPQISKVTMINAGLNQLSHVSLITIGSVTFDQVVSAHLSPHNHGVITTHNVGEQLARQFALHLSDVDDLDRLGKLVTDSLLFRYRYRILRYLINGEPIPKFTSTVPSYEGGSLSRLEPITETMASYLTIPELVNQQLIPALVTQLPYRLNEVLEHVTEHPEVAIQLYKLGIFNDTDLMALAREAMIAHLPTTVALIQRVIGLDRINQAVRDLNRYGMYRRLLSGIDLAMAGYETAGLLLPVGNMMQDLDILYEYWKQYYTPAYHAASKPSLASRNTPIAVQLLGLIIDRLAFLASVVTKVPLEITETLLSNTLIEYRNEMRYILRNVSEAYLNMYIKVMMTLTRTKE